MEVKDLMIGDLVRVNRDVCIKNDTIVRVCGIDATNRLVEKGLEGSATCVPVDDIDFYSGGIWVKYLSPIPLTPEILEKNGFVLKEEEEGMFGVKIAPHYIRDDVPFEVFCDGEPFAIWFKDPVNIEYVHQLQHVLRLCGISLDIKL